jgi:hypothetical protein
MYHLPFSPRSGFLFGNGAPLFFTCFDYVVFLILILITRMTNRDQTKKKGDIYTQPNSTAVEKL